MRRSALIAGLTFLVSACGASPSSSGGAASSAGVTPTGASCARLAGLSGDVDDHGNVAATGSAVVFSIGDSFFNPTCVSMVAAGTVRVTIDNKGSSLHNFSVPDQGIDTDIAPGETATVTVSVGRDPVAFFCKYHRTSGMQGALIPAGS